MYFKINHLAAAHEYAQSTYGARNAAIALGLTSASLLLTKGKTSAISFDLGLLYLIPHSTSVWHDFHGLPGMAVIVWPHNLLKSLEDKLLKAKTAEAEVETPAETQGATGSTSSENEAPKSEDSRKGFRKRNITAYENKLR